MRAVILTDVVNADGPLSASFYDKKIDTMQELMARAGIGVKISCQDDRVIAELLPGGDPETAGAFLTKHFEVEKVQDTAVWMEVDNVSTRKDPATGGEKAVESIDKSAAVKPNTRSEAGAAKALGEVKIRVCMVNLHNRRHFVYRSDARAYIEPFKCLDFIWVDRWDKKHERGK